MADDTDTFVSGWEHCEMTNRVVNLSDYRVCIPKIEETEVLEIAKEVELATLNLVNEFAKRHPDYPDTFFAFLVNQCLLGTASECAEKGHEGALRLLSHAKDFLEEFERHLNSTGSTLTLAKRKSTLDNIYTFQ